MYVKEGEERVREGIREREGRWRGGGVEVAGSGI